MISSVISVYHAGCPVIGVPFMLKQNNITTKKENEQAFSAAPESKTSGTAHSSLFSNFISPNLYRKIS